MTNTREINTLFKPIINRNQDVFINGPMLGIRPVHHLYRGVYIKKSPTKNFYSPRYVAFHLFQWRWIAIPMESGRWLNRRSGLPGAWYHSDQVAAQDFIDVVEAEALPFLRGLTSIADYYELKLSTSCLTPILELDEIAVVVEVALGDLDRARRTFSRIKPHHLDIVGTSSEVARGIAERLTRLGTYLFADDRASLATLLHKWEQESVKTFKLEAYWQPTSFPLEESV